MKLLAWEGNSRCKRFRCACIRHGKIRDMFREFLSARIMSLYHPASLVPRDDPTLLLTGTGMVPFKPYIGTAKPEHLHYNYLSKCIRTLDIENVERNFSASDFLNA